MINKNVEGALLGLQKSIALQNWYSKQGKEYDSISALKDALPPADVLDFQKEIWNELIHIFGKSHDDFRVWVDAVDSYINQHDAFEDYSELIFDLLMINFLANEDGKLEDEYFETDEWEQIEEGYLDRGTEALNLFLYLQEAKDEEIEPDLDDFLDEFLLIDEEDFQDELAIYEMVIANRNLIDEPFGSLVKNALSLEENSDLGELLLPIFVLFKKPEEPTLGMLAVLRNLPDDAFRLSVLGALYGFYHGEILD